MVYPRRHGLPVSHFLSDFCACFVRFEQPTTKLVSTAVEHKTETYEPAPDAKPAKIVALENDSTLYPDEYEARGMPSIQNPWTIKDYEAAIPTLVALANENPSLLPRFNSTRSGSVFRRMVARENLDIYTNKDIDWQIRNTSLLAFARFFPNMTTGYLNALQSWDMLWR
jgi:hypothetical protein